MDGRLDADQKFVECLIGEAAVFRLGSSVLRSEAFRRRASFPEQSTIMDNQAQVRHRPVIRVFVSSTFTDLKHERDALQREVFPKLEQFCASWQFQFQAIDLRWGVSTEASLDHRTMRICFEELRRSQEISPQPTS